MLLLLPPQLPASKAEQQQQQQPTATTTAAAAAVAEQLHQQPSQHQHEHLQQQSEAVAASAHRAQLRPYRQCNSQPGSKEQALGSWVKGSPVHNSSLTSRLFLYQTIRVKEAADEADDMSCAGSRSRGGERLLAGSTALNVGGYLICAGLVSFEALAFGADESPFVSLVS